MRIRVTAIVPGDPDQVKSHHRHKVRESKLYARDRDRNGDQRLNKAEHHGECYEKSVQCDIYCLFFSIHRIDPSSFLTFKSLFVRIKNQIL